MRTRPVSVEFECKGDVEYLLENKRSLKKGVFVDREYGIETEQHRKILKPIFNAARRNSNYKGKCRLDANVLVIQDKEYTVDNLHTLPEDINEFSVTSKTSATTLAFFGELNPFSNFYHCEFEYTGISFHSSEQIIQYMKSIFFEDNDSATYILNCDTPLECKRAACNIRGYNHETWGKCAKEMCEGGIYQKFVQNQRLMDYLLKTNNLKVVEASNDKTWGRGVHLWDGQALAEETWYSQGLLGTILEEVRTELKNTKGHNTTDAEDMEMETGVGAAETEREPVS